MRLFSAVLEVGGVRSCSLVWCDEGSMGVLQTIETSWSYEWAGGDRGPIPFCMGAVSEGKGRPDGRVGERQRHRMDGKCWKMMAGGGGRRLSKAN